MSLSCFRHLVTRHIAAARLNPPPNHKRLVFGLKGVAEMLRTVAFLCVLFVSACGFSHRDGPPPPPTESGITALEAAILNLGSDVDPEEAARAARIAMEYTHQLALEYQIEDSPLAHNTKVNLGIKPRGLCYHWANDLQDRLEAEGFRTLQMHHAIANAFNPILIEHSTTMISRMGAPMEESIILDGWRQAGELFWTPFAEDTKYTWVLRSEVWAEKRRRREMEEARGL